MHPTTKSPSEMAYCGQAKAKPEAQLGDSRSQSDEPRNLGWWQFPTNPNCYTLTITPSRVRSVVWG